MLIEVQRTHLGYSTSCQEKRDEQRKEDAPWVKSVDQRCESCHYDSRRGQGIVGIGAVNKEEGRWNGDERLHSS